jgi:hypothetical protein
MLAIAISRNGPSYWRSTSPDIPSPDHLCLASRTEDVLPTSSVKQAAISFVRNRNPRCRGDDRLRTTGLNVIGKQVGLE